MGLYEEAEQDTDKALVKQMKDDFSVIIGRANDYIDKIITDRYGDMAKYVSHIELLKTNLTTLKTKYNTSAVDSEIDGYLAQMDSATNEVKTRWDNEVYIKLNG